MTSNVVLSYLVLSQDQFLSILDQLSTVSCLIKIVIQTELFSGAGPISNKEKVSTTLTLLESMMFH